MRKSLKLKEPEGNLTQPFGANYNPYYKQSGLKAHTGRDYTIGWKKPIRAATDGEVYSVRRPTKDTEKYTAVYQIIDTPKASYEVSYGHLDSIKVKKGQMVLAGEIIGTEGNFGACFSGGVRVTPAKKKLGWGSHLHFQVRKCKRVEKIEKGKKYLETSAGAYKKDGMYYEVVDYENGYNGCVDPKRFFEMSPKEILNFILILKKLGVLK